MQSSPSIPIRSHEIFKTYFQTIGSDNLRPIVCRILSKGNDSKWSKLHFTQTTGWFGAVMIVVHNLQIILIFGIDNGISIAKGWIYQNDTRSQMETIVILIKSIFQAGSFAFPASIMNGAVMGNGNTSANSLSLKVFGVKR